MLDNGTIGHHGDGVRAAVEMAARVFQRQSACRNKVEAERIEAV
ncbi:MAG: hypothetical protein RLZZ157_1466, partial [Pseudomonadota bacterium]